MDWKWSVGVGISMCGSVIGPHDSVRYMLSTGGMTDTVGTSAHYKVASISDTVDPTPKMHPQVCSRLGLVDF